MEAVFNKSQSHDANMEDGTEVVITSPSTRFLSPSANQPPPSRKRQCSACLGTDHELPGGECHRSINDSSSSMSGSNSSLSTDRHCHERKTGPDIDRRARRKLLIAMGLSLTFMIGEVIGGIFAGSLAIVSDAAHLLTDFASFLISLLALYLASRKATKKLSFGWYRAEILGALMSILFLWVVTGVLVYMGVERCINQDFEVEATIMLITAGCGVAFNLLMGLTLHPHGHQHSHGHKKSSAESDCEKLLIRDDTIQRSNGYMSYGTLPSQIVSSHESGHSRKDNINVKAAFIHVLGDLLQSIGVLIAAFIIYFKPDWKLADPICTFLFSVFVVITTLTIMRDILVVLMEGTPRGLDFAEIRQSFYEIKEVKDIHDLRVWSLSMDKTALSVHLAVEKNANTIEILKQASYMIQSRFNISETTIQVEEFVDDMVDCSHCQDLQD